MTRWKTVHRRARNRIEREQWAQAVAIARAMSRDFSEVERSILVSIGAQFGKSYEQVSAEMRAAEASNFVSVWRGYRSPNRGPRR